MEIEELTKGVYSKIENVLSGIVEDYFIHKDMGGSRVYDYETIFDYIYEDMIYDDEYEDFEEELIENEIKRVLEIYEHEDFDYDRERRIFVITK